VWLFFALLCHFADAEEEFSVILVDHAMNEAIPFRQKSVHLVSIEDGVAIKVDETQKGK